MYVEVETRVALALIAALMLWRHRPLLVRKAAEGASLFEEYARGHGWKRGDYAAAS